MKPNIKKITLAAVLLCGVAYTAAYICVRAQTVNALAERFGPKTEIKSVMLFADGVVLRDISFEGGKIGKFFLQGNPFHLFFSGPERIWIDKATLESPHILLKQNILPDNTMLEMDAFDIALSGYRVSGAVKTIGKNAYLMNFSATDPTLSLEGRAEIKREKDGYLTFDAEFDDAQLKHPLVSAWRGSGWVHLAHEKDNWQITGQTDAGRVTFGDLDLTDPVLRLSGTLNIPQISFSGLSGTDQTPVSFDTTDKYLIVAYRDISKKVSRESISQKQLRALSAFVGHDLEPRPEPVQQKPTTPVTSKLVEELPVLEDNFEVVEVDIIQKPLKELIQNSFFEGLLYDKPLTLVEESCDGVPCWKARGQGGTLSYKDDAVPSYLLRLKDYEQSIQLRGILHSLKIDRLTVTGRGDKVIGMDVKGRLPDDQEVHIDLSLGDVH